MTSPQAAAEDRAAYSPAEVAQLLGVTRQHIHNLISRNEISSFKVGASRRIPATEVDRILTEGTGAA